ncbi:MAG: L-hydantoinase [Fimbriimonadaceae bacterium]|nr:L-hydantoinase [Fimbriimonadaceae bacterium]
MFDWVIRGGEVIRPEGIAREDLAIAGGRIVALGDLTGAEAENTFDASGMQILPGVIDTQVHFREPGLEHKEDIATGSEAAAAGGVTTFFEMPNTLPPTTTAAFLENKLARAKGRASANYAFFVGAALDNIPDLERLEMLPGTPGIKLFMGSSTGTLLVPDDENVRAVMQGGKRPMPVHAEDEARLRARKEMFPAPDVSDHPIIRDAEAARLATERLILLSRETGRHVHILHVSTGDEVPIIRSAKAEGVALTAEVTPQHLWFEWPSAYRELGSLVQMNPPIRSAEHREALWAGLLEGVFDVFGSDHAPHTLEEKQKPYPQSPSGMTGVQTLLPVLLTFVDQGRLPLDQVVTMTSRNPARLYGIKDRGEIALGAWADLAIVELQRKFTVRREWIRSRSQWSPYEGVELTGFPVQAFVSGVPAAPGAGRMVEFDWKLSG